MVNDITIKQMLEKAGAFPFIFGGSDESFAWRAAEVEDEIFVERVQVVGKNTFTSYYYCFAYDASSRRNMYEDMIIDFVVYYHETWRCHEASDVFDVIAGIDDRGLLEILGVFHKKYADFLNDVMFWFSIVVETEPNEYGVRKIAKTSILSPDERIVKHVLDRLSSSNPILIATEDAEYLWRIERFRGEIWFLKSTRRYRDEYTFVSNEYGHIQPKDEDAFNALRDAIRSCFYVEGWELINVEANVDEKLAIVDLSLDELSV